MEAGHWRVLCFNLPTELQIKVSERTVRMEVTHRQFPFLQLPMELQIEVVERSPDALSLYNFILTCKCCNKIGTIASRRFFQRMLARIPRQLQRPALAIVATMTDRDLLRHEGIEGFLRKYIHNDPPITHTKGPLNPSYMYLISQVLEETHFRAKTFLKKTISICSAIIQNHPLDHVISQTEIYRIQRAFLHLQLCAHLLAFAPIGWASARNMRRHFTGCEVFELLSLLYWLLTIPPVTRFRLSNYMPHTWRAMNSTTTQRLHELLTLPTLRMPNMPNTDDPGDLLTYLYNPVENADWEALDDSPITPSTVKDTLDEPSALFASALRHDAVMELIGKPDIYAMGLVFWDAKHLRPILDGLGKPDLLPLISPCDASTQMMGTTPQPQR